MLCQCGCGQKPRQESSLYCHGHFHKGKTWEEEFGKEKADNMKESIGNKKKDYLKSHEHPMKRPEVRAKIQGKNSGMYGKKHSESSKLKMSLTRKGKYTGINCSHWKGGISKILYPNEYDYPLRKEVRKRDNYTCQLCGAQEKIIGRALDVHHIDYIKENIKLYNLIALCHSCNARVNGYREKWKCYFQERMKNRFENPLKFHFTYTTKNKGEII